MSRFLIPRPSPPPAAIARERLENLLEHDRNLVSHRDLVAVLREEIHAVVQRHADIDTGSVHFSVVRSSPTASTLQVDIEVPATARATAAPWFL
jgi:cell division topological specificity factor